MSELSERQERIADAVRAWTTAVYQTSDAAERARLGDEVLRLIQADPVSVAYMLAVSYLPDDMTAK